MKNYLLVHGAWHGAWAWEETKRSLEARGHHVITIDLGIAAQLRAGDSVRFLEVSLQDAHRLLLERERDLERFRIGLSLQTA